MVKKTVLAAGVLVLGVLLAHSLGSRSVILCKGFLPENGMKIPVGSRNSLTMMSGGAQGGITEDQYNEVMDTIEKVYGPVVASRGGQLVINRLWNDATVN